MNSYQKVDYLINCLIINNITNFINFTSFDLCYLFGVKPNLNFYITFKRTFVTRAFTIAGLPRAVVYKRSKKRTTFSWY